MKSAISKTKSVGQSKTVKAWLSSLNHVRERVMSFYQKHPNVCLGILFVVVWAVAAYAFYMRYPQNFIYPNFFAEDGDRFVVNILDKGMFGAMMTTFNGYFVWGLYLVSFIGVGINQILYGGQFVDLPASFALASYGFLGFAAALPLVLMRPYMTWPWRLGLVPVVVLLPMQAFDYGTIGTLGNIKFAVAYVAVLLIMYRFTLPRGSRKLFIVDASLIVCIYTAASVYLMLPFLLFCDGLRPKQLLDRKKWKETFSWQNFSLWGAVAIGLAAFLQLVYIKLHGIPKFPGYLDQPYQFEDTVEIFVARSYLYPAVSWFYSHLSDFTSLAIFAGVVAAMWRFGTKQHRRLYLFGMYAIFAGTFVLIVNRTGISVHYNHYQTSAFDNFFYAGNYVFIVLGALLLSDISQKASCFRKAHIALVLLVVLIFGSIATNHSYAPNDFMHYQIGTLREQLRHSCSDKNRKDITFTIYPFDFLKVTQPRSLVCTPRVSSEKLTAVESFGLRPTENMPLEIGWGQPAFYQTFTAGNNNLKGLVVYLSTYYEDELEGYHLYVKDADCKQNIRSLPLPLHVRDNSYRTMYFDPIKNSKGKTFCFSIQPDKAGVQKLAVQLSKEYVYEKGDLTILETQSSRDIVFQALYE